MNFPAYTRQGWWWTPVSAWLASVTKVQFVSYDISWVDSSIAIQPLINNWITAQNNYNIIINYNLFNNF